MIPEIDWMNPELVDKRQEIAPQVTLSPQNLEYNRQLLAEDCVRYTQLEEEEQRPLLAHLIALRAHLPTVKSYPISARLLTAYFVLSTEGEKLLGTAADVLNQEAELGTNMANHLFAHNFDIASGVIAAVDRIVIVEDELNGLTTQRIERRDQLAREGSHGLPLAEFAEVYGESIAYAKDSVDLLSQDKSATPGILLFKDLIDKVKAGQFVPGILPESFTELVLLGMEDTMEVYQTVYPLAARLISPTSSD